MSEENQNEEPWRDADFYFHLGNYQFDKGNYDGAIASYNKAINLDDSEPDYFNNKGNGQCEKGDYDAAIKSYDEAINLDKNFANYFFNKGNAQASKGDYDAAIASYNNAINLDGNVSAYFYNKGGSQDAKGDCDAAIDSYNKAINLDDSNPIFFNNRGITQFKKGDYDGAIASYSKAIELNDSNSDYYYNKGRIQEAKGDYDAAIKSYDEAINRDDSNPSYFFNKGNAQDAKGDYDGAIESYNKAIGLDDSKDEYYNNRGNAYYYNGNYKDALASFTDAIKLNDNDALYYNNRGNIHSYMEEKEEAVSDWYKSFELAEVNNIRDEQAERIYKYIIENNISNDYGKSLEMLGYMLSSTRFFDVDFKNSEINKQMDHLEVGEITEKIKKSSLDTYNKHLLPLLADLKVFDKEKDYIKNIFQILALVKGFKKNRHWAAAETKNRKGKHLFFQYTSIDVLKIFLGLNGEGNTENNITLRLNNTNYMNDPTEGNYFLSNVLKASKKSTNKKSTNQLIKGLIKQDDSHAFIASLTFAKQDDIPMWNMYGRNGKGVAIGLELPDSIFEQTNGQNVTLSNTSVGNLSTQTQSSFSKVSGSEKEHVDEKSLLYKIYYYGEKGGTSKNKKEADKLLKKIKCVFHDLIDVYDSLKALPQLKNEKKNVENFIEFIKWEFDRIKFLIKDKQYQYEDEYRILRLTKDYKEAEHDQNDPRLFTKVKDVKMREVIFGAESDSASYWIPVIYKILGDDVEVRDSDTSIKF